VWLGGLADSSHVARRVGLLGGGYYASPAYLERRGKPQRPEDVASHEAIVVPRGDRTEWFFVVDGKTKRIPVRGRSS
jgi:hypothetical protein